MDKTKDGQGKIKIPEVIVVEGIRDRQAIDRAVEADCIMTQGSTLSPETMRMIKRAQAERGIIIFTDPDYVGERLRKEISREITSCKHAFLPPAKAVRDGDIGIENASPRDIRQALTQARVQIEVSETSTQRDTHKSSIESTKKSGQVADNEDKIYLASEKSEADSDYQAVSWDLIMALGLNGRPDSKDKRIKLAEELGIGYANARQFWKRLQQLRIGEAELMAAYQKLLE